MIENSGDSITRPESMYVCTRLKNAADGVTKADVENIPLVDRRFFFHLCPSYKDTNPIEFSPDNISELSTVKQRFYFEPTTII